MFMANHASMFLVLLSFSLPLLQTSESSQICHGRQDNLCSWKMKVFTLYISLMADSTSDLILAVPNSLLKALALDRSAAQYWIRNNVLDFADRLQLRYITVGYEVRQGDPARAPFLLPAMRNLHDELRSAGLDHRIKVSTAVDAREFGEAAAQASLVAPIVGFLVETRSPILVNVYRYLSVGFDGRRRRLSYRDSLNETEALSAAAADGFDDVIDRYDDSNLEALRSALDGIDGGGELEMVVAECDWPLDGGNNGDMPMLYVRNLIDYVRIGTSFNMTNDS